MNLVRIKLHSDISQTSSVSDLARRELEEILAEAESYVYSDARKAISIAESALQKSIDASNGWGTARSHFVIGWARYATAQFELSKQHTRKGLQIAVNIEDAHLQFAILNLLTGVEVASGKLEDALDLALQTNRMAIKLDDHGLQATSSLNLGQLYRQSGQYDKALEAVKHSLLLFGEDKISSRVAQAYREYGTVLGALGDYQASLENLMTGLEIEKTFGNELLISDIFNDLGITLKRMDRLEEAENYLRQSLALREKVGDIYNASMTLMNIGTVRDRQGNYAEAIELYQQAQEKIKKIGSKKGELLIEQNLSTAYEKLGDFKTAIDHFKRMHELHDELVTITMEEKEQRISAQAEAERLNQEAEIERLKTVELVKAQRLARVGSYSWDADTDEFKGSEEFVRLLGRHQGEEVCNLEHFLSKIKADDRGQVRKAFQSALRVHSGVDVVARAEVIVRGHHLTYHIIGEWEENPAGIRRMSGTLQDITLQLEADEARREREKLEGMLEMAGAFSHEINQPMQVIVTATELLLYRFPDNREVAKSVEMILKASARMSEITSRLMRTTTYKTKPYVGETRIVDAGAENI